MLHGALMVIGFCIMTIGGIGLLYATYYQLRIAKFRRSDVSWTRARWMYSIIAHPEYYNDEGLRIRQRVMQGVLLFFGAVALCILIRYLQHTTGGVMR